ncbi:hypothetical protein RJ639_047376 [Escallonia herrerae]|uniref:Reverse transcriptase Ty1/copia-type domain-containing protein n=1 Tax=Escallonia herrerae TaxID=1293975 RepID=A0AA88W974_9ASTE|nr:hypothetical protein RJ639_047376 [Escallonia herrerae]
MSWLINMMNLEIGQNFIFYGTAKEVWENVEETYSDNENTPELFEIKGILHNLQQGDASVTQYYNLLTRYWQQLDMFEKITWDCQLDKKKYDKIVEKERIFKLLLGLNKDLDEVRGRILGTKPLPSLREAFSEVRREESRKKIMMGRPGIQNSGESSAPAAYGTNYKGSDNQPHKDVVFSKEQLELLQNMFNQAQINPPVIGSGTIAQKGIFPSALNSKVEKSNPWVIDTGASDHMTGDISLFSSYSACSNNYKDQDSGKMIGNAKECAGLYLLKDGNLVNETRTDQCISNSVLVSQSDRDLTFVSNHDNNPIMKPRDNEVEHPILPESYQDPNPSTVPAESEMKTILTKEFEIKDLGKLKYFLGMEVARSNKGISISQRKYTHDLLKETGMLGCKPVDTPMDPICKLGRKEGSAPVDKGRYQSLIGRLIYLSHTRPDIGFSVSVVSQFMNNPTEEHLDAVYKILRYLKMTPGKGLFFKKGYRKNIDIYCDANWAGSITDRRSTSGYCTYVWGNLVTWRSKKQSVVSRSSAEAEFRAIALSICEGMWLKRLLEELKITCEGSIKVFCDNQASINIAKNLVHHDRTKHVEIDRHFIREKIEGGIIQMVYTPSSHQTADILTKALPKGNFDNLNSKLGMINIYSQLEGE